MRMVLFQAKDPSRAHYAEKCLEGGVDFMELSNEGEGRSKESMMENFIQVWHSRRSARLCAAIVLLGVQGLLEASGTPFLQFHSHTNPESIAQPNVRTHQHLVEMVRTMILVREEQLEDEGSIAHEPALAYEAIKCVDTSLLAEVESGEVITCSTHPQKGELPLPLSYGQICAFAREFNSWHGGVRPTRFVCRGETPYSSIRAKPYTARLRLARRPRADIVGYLELFSSDGKRVYAEQDGIRGLGL